MTRAEPRWRFVAYSSALGLVVAAAALVGGERSLALFAVPWFVACGVAMSFTPWGTLSARSQDERERSVHTQAVAMSGCVVICVIVVGWLVELARGNDTHPWTMLGFIGGASYAISLAVLSRRS